MIDQSQFDQERVTRPRGFTLVELLVAMAVLSLLVVMLAQVVALTGQAISVNTEKLGTAGQARLVFDRVASDLAARPRRSDLGMIFTKAAGNDRFQFYSEVDGYSGARQIAVVGYRIQQTTAGRLYQLERGAVGTDWGPTAGSNPFVQFLPNTLTVATNADPNYDVLASEVFRLEFCFLLNTGSMSNSANSDYSNVAAVVVAVGVLDNNSRQVVSTSQLQQLATALPDDIEGQDPISGWNSAMAQVGFAAGIPPQVIQNIRVYQRTFCVP